MPWQSGQVRVIEFFVDLIAVARLLDVLGVAAQQAGGDALEAPPADGGGRLDVREMPAELGALHTVEQQIALSSR